MQDLVNLQTSLWLRIPSFYQFLLTLFMVIAKIDPFTDLLDLDGLDFFKKH